MNRMQNSEFRVQNPLNQQSFSRNGVKPAQPKRNLKLYIWVIIISIIIGIAVFFLTRGSDTVASPNAPKELPSDTSSSENDPGYYPSPSSKPTPPPLDENSNLEAEVEKLDPKDYSGDFENLKKQI